MQTNLVDNNKMGNTETKSPKSSSCSSISSFQQNSTSDSKSSYLQKSLRYQHILQVSRKSYIDSWVCSMTRILTKKKKQHLKWQKSCDRIIQSLEDLSFGDLEKIFSVIDQIDSKESLEIRYKELSQKQTKNYPLRKAKTIKIDVNSFGKIMKRRAKLRGQSAETIQSNTIKQIKTQLQFVLQRQFNKQYHPFYKIKTIFTESLLETYSVYLTKQHSQQQQTHIAQQLNRQLSGVIKFLIKSCIIYKQWIQKFTNLKQKGFSRFISKALINSLFNKSNLHSIIYNIIKKCNVKYISTIAINLKQNVSISKFKIKKSLQIQGNYIQSMIMLSEIDKIKHPQHLLSFFQRFKLQIQNDIEVFNETFNKNEEITIDGDSLLSIICFMLCRMKAKIDVIYAQLMVLHVVYGESILTEHDTASYIVTAMLASIDYLKSEEFKEIVNSEET